MMELNKYDLILWVADIIWNHQVLCNQCMFYNECGRKNKDCICYNKTKLVNELLKKYNL